MEKWFLFEKQFGAFTTCEECRPTMVEEGALHHDISLKAYENAYVQRLFPEDMIEDEYCECCGKPAFLGE